MTNSLLEEALERRDAARERYLRYDLRLTMDTATLRGFSLGSVEKRIPLDRRLSLGVAFPKDDIARNSLGLAIRVAKRDGMAYRAAMAIAEREFANGGWAEIRHVEQRRLPTRDELAASGPKPAVPPQGSDPLRLGTSVTLAKGGSSSLGGFVMIPGHGEGFVGASHGLANGGRGIDPVDKPIVYDATRRDAGGRLIGRDVIGALHEYIPLDTDPVYLDMAVVRLTANRPVLGNVIPPIAGAVDVGAAILPPPPANAIPFLGRVAKIGRTTGYTEGRLSAGYFSDLEFEVPGISIVYYDNMYEIEGTIAYPVFGDSGDSGAIIFDCNNKKAFGMLVGGGVHRDDDGMGHPLIYACDLASGLREVGADWV